ncbi:Ig domain-containing protein [Verrucomicrobium spinosum]|uniref:Ig domain-containing protein n=1 Tax=Verrucomicrobium spinosum TaxID=2736 RepID=UPI0009461B08|nr:Ig domain-containing protein [Verrucomicrobium spinosum]
MGLPAGLAINGTTGRISGAATEAGVYVVTLTATNGDGTSAPLFLAVGIETSEYNADAFVEVDVNLLTGAVSLPGGNFSATAVLFGKKGDWLMLSVGFRKGNVLQDLEISALSYALKEYDPEQLLVQSDGDFEKVGSYESTRYRILVHLDPDALAGVLSNYEGDKATNFAGVSELRWGVLHTLPGDEDPTVLERSSQNFTTEIFRDQTPDLTED